MTMQNKMITLITATALGVCTASLAQPTAREPAPPPNPFNMQQFTAAMSDIMKEQFSSIVQEMKTLYVKGFKHVDQQNYQSDPDLKEIRKANAISTAELTATYGQLLTQSSLDNNLKQSQYAIRPYSDSSATSQ